MMIAPENQQLFEMIQRFRSLNLLATLPLPRQDYMVLHAVDCLQKEHPDACTVSMITKKMRIPQPAVSRTLRNLENGGYLQREVCRSDRRNTYVLLTDAGKKAVHAHFGL